MAEVTASSTSHNRCYKWRLRPGSSLRGWRCCVLWQLPVQSRKYVRRSRCSLLIHRLKEKEDPLRNYHWLYGLLHPDPHHILNMAVRFIWLNQPQGWIGVISLSLYGCVQSEGCRVHGAILPCRAPAALRRWGMALQQQQRNSMTCWRACQLRALKTLQRTGQGRSCMRLTMCGAKRQTVLLVVTLAGQRPVLCCTGQSGHSVCMLCMQGWWQQQVRRCSFYPCSVPCL